MKKNPRFLAKENSHFLKDFRTICCPNIDLSNFKRGSCRHKSKKYGPERTSHHTFFLTVQNNHKHASYFAMNRCISLKFIYKSKTQYCSHKKTKKSCILLTAKSRSARGASRHPAFMDSSLTVSQTRLPCSPCGKMGLQSWTAVMAVNILSIYIPRQSW